MLFEVKIEEDFCGFAKYNQILIESDSAFFAERQAARIAIGLGTKKDFDGNFDETMANIEECELPESYSFDGGKLTISIVDVVKTTKEEWLEKQYLKAIRFGRLG